MKATSYNKSEIMKQAWMMFQNKFFGFTSFGEALKRAWYYAKQEVARIKQVETRKAAQTAADAERLTNKVEINEDTRNAIAVLQAAVFPDVPEEKEKRVFQMEVKGFKSEY